MQYQPVGFSLPVGTSVSGKYFSFGQNFSASPAAFMNAAGYYGGSTIAGAHTQEQYPNPTIKNYSFGVNQTGIDAKIKDEGGSSA